MSMLGTWRGVDRARTDVTNLAAAPRGQAAVIFAMLLFGLAYPMVHYGSEARGYAGLVLFLLFAVVFLEHALDGSDWPLRHSLGAAIGLGLLCHLTMVAVGTPQCPLGFERGASFASSPARPAMDDLSPRAADIGDIFGLDQAHANEAVTGKVPDDVSVLGAFGSLGFAFEAQNETVLTGHSVHDARGDDIV